MILLQLWDQRHWHFHFFHAFSGCDTASSFLGKGKKSAWQTWSVFDKVTATFTKLSSTPESVCCEDLQSSSCTGVSEARLDLFARKQRAYPSPGDWRWTKVDGTWVPHWTELAAVTKSCQELTCSGCKVHCSGRCRCFKAGLSCTALCECTCQYN